MEHIDYKVDGGKLLRIDIEIKEGVIEELKIRGDFFIHPEEGLRDLEEGLQGSSMENIQKNVKDILETKGLEIIGFSSEDIQYAVSKAENGK